MKKYKLFSVIFKVLAMVLSNAMCAVVAFCYCDMLWGIRYCGYSAPAGTAFLLAIPFALGILACLLLSRFFCKRH